MTDKTIDDNLDELFKEENPTAEAVKSLINVKSRKVGEPSEVELKTDLSDDEVKLHTVLSTIHNILEAKPDKFNKECILLNVIESKERKALSKNRLSRSEIVQVARQPDMNMGMMGEMPQKQGFIKRFLTSRKNREIPQ